MVMNLASSLIGVILFLLYDRYAYFAGLARRVMRGLELSWGLSAFSYNYQHLQPSARTFGTYKLVRFMILLPVLLNVTVALWLFAKYDLLERLESEILTVWHFFTGAAA
jgi:hypothetical protein